MPQFRSLPSIESSVADSQEEPEAYLASQTPITSLLVPARYSGQPHSQPGTNEFSPVSQPLHNISTTQSLINALQTSTFSPRKTEQLIVIPGSNKRTRLLPEAQVAQVPVRRMRRRTRQGIALGSIAFVMLFIMLTLAPLDGGQSTFHIFNGVVKWANTQQQDWNILAHSSDTTTTSVTVPPIATVAGNPPAITLPTSQYVAITRQDAINAGIPPDYFVRQIYAESGFDPNAASPAGAVGIAQFEPGTAAGLGINPYDPIQALGGAARLMASYAIQYNGDYAKALAAYNAGGGNVDYAVRTCGAGWLNCVPAETQNYIYKSMGL